MSTKILDCEHESTGYGTYSDGKTACYECIAVRDGERMSADGDSKSLPLYLSNDSKSGMKLSNWPGTLVFEPRRVRFASVTAFGGYIKRTYARFTGPDGREWWGFHQGDNNQVFHARRCKS